MRLSDLISLSLPACVCVSVFPWLAALAQLLWNKDEAWQDQFVGLALKRR